MAHDTHMHKSTILRFRKHSSEFQLFVEIFYKKYLKTLVLKTNLFLKQIFR